MKKKIKDLTDEEIKSICDRHFFCHKCPLNHHIKCRYVDNNLDRKVEIDESNNDKH